MSNKITAAENITLTEKQLKAAELHKQILVNGQVAADALVELAKNLKEMRDTKLYLELGFENFESYCECAAHIKQRQAYSFIKALEELGEQKMLENSGLGITKLAALATLCAEDRETLIEHENIEQLSTRELEEKIAELKKKCEQLSFDMESEQSISQEISNERDKLEEKLRELEAENKKLRDRPIDIAVAEPSEADIAKIKENLSKELTEAKDKEIESLKKEKEAAVNESKNASKELEAKIAELEKEREQLRYDIETEKLSAKSSSKERDKLKEKVKEMEKQVEVLQSTAKNPPEGNSNKELLKYHFSAIQSGFNAAAEIVGSLDGAEKEKFKGAVLKLLQGCREAVEKI